MPPDDHVGRRVLGGFGPSARPSERTTGAIRRATPPPRQAAPARRSRHVMGCGRRRRPSRELGRPLAPDPPDASDARRARSSPIDRADDARGTDTARPARRRAVTTRPVAVREVELDVVVALGRRPEPQLVEGGVRPDGEEPRLCVGRGDLVDLLTVAEPGHVLGGAVRGGVVQRRCRHPRGDRGVEALGQHARVGVVPLAQDRPRRVLGTRMIHGRVEHGQVPQPGRPVGREVLAWAAVIGTLRGVHIPSAESCQAQSWGEKCCQPRR